MLTSCMPENPANNCNISRRSRGMVYLDILCINVKGGLEDRCPEGGTEYWTMDTTLYSPWPCVIAEDFPMSPAPSTHIHSLARDT